MGSVDQCMVPGRYQRYTENVDIRRLIPKY